MPIDNRGPGRVRLENANKGPLRTLGFLFIETYQGALYFLSFLPLVLVLGYFKRAHPAMLLAVVIAGCYFAGLVFLLLVVTAKKILTGHFDADEVVTIHTRSGKQFFFASMLHGIMQASPFRALICGFSPLTSYYYRAIGAKMAPTVFISSGARIFDPWFVEIQDNATIGADAVITGHIGDGPQIILGRVFVGEGAIVGARSIIMPDVRIGRHARVGVGAVVVRGTVIPDGETWGGVPARQIAEKVKAAGAQAGA
ncbi:MAG TPA: hypothetical protein VH369_24395 [Bryobacteraceae bacterium]|jgi:acetyltransferase-like isoleucine patch superfamily enzyme